MGVLKCSGMSGLSLGRYWTHLHLFYMFLQAWTRVFDQICFSLMLFQLVMVGIMGEFPSNTHHTAQAHSTAARSYCDTQWVCLAACFMPGAGIKQMVAPPLVVLPLLPLTAFFWWSSHKLFWRPQMVRASSCGTLHGSHVELCHLPSWPSMPPKLASGHSPWWGTDAGIGRCGAAG